MKRFLFLGFTLLCSLLLCGTALAADATPPAIPTEGDVWDGTAEAPTKIVQKDGVSYYEITKCSQLAYLATVEEGANWLSYNYILGNDLILNNVVLTWDKDGNLLTDSDELYQWTPIKAFEGKFLGNHYTISGLYINATDDNKRVGLFAELYYGCIEDLQVVNSHVENQSSRLRAATGGIVAVSESTLSGCSMSGVVKGTSSVGGLCGAGYGFSQCTNYAAVYGDQTTGGLCGDSGDFYRCGNYGSVHGINDVGGIVGNNYGGTIEKSCNFGTVSGTNCVGGIMGNTFGFVSDCYNAGTVQGAESVGGIAGSTVSMATRRSVSRSYNIGAITGTTYIGAVIGESGTVWGNGSVENCYYLKNESITGFGNGADVENSVTVATATELKQQSTFVNWDFTGSQDSWNPSDPIWAIDPEINGGYPYLQWQSLDTIPVTGVSLNKAALTLGVGDAQYLTATLSPVTAETTLSWKSSNTAVATVTKSGKVTALAPGSADITVTTEDGGFSATCTVTVTARAQDEYRLGTIRLESQSGEVLTAIPKGSFWVSVPLTHLQDSGNAVVMLAAYNTAGQYLGVLCARAEDLPKNSTVRLSLLVDNSAGNVAQVKAFVVPSLSDVTPIGTAVST